MNYCSKCGDPVDLNEKFCNKCGNPLQTNNINNKNNNFQPSPTSLNNIQQFPKLNNQVVNNINPVNYNQNNSNNKKGIFIGIGIGIGALALILIGFLMINSSSNKYYFDTEFQENEEKEVVGRTETKTSKRGKYSTIIVYDNTYSGVMINKNEDAYKLIEKDSVSQKDNCPPEIKAIENDIIRKYGITAVNLCEMDVNFAKEIDNVIKNIYEEYPSARGHLTNISLANAPMSQNYIAAFMPIFNFATSSATTSYPWIIKTQVLLNTSYFLNTERLQASVTDGSTAGHFPPNATMYSPVAHEFGHYLSFLAMMKNYKQDSILLVDEKNINNLYEIYSDFADGKFSLVMINEAYENYKKDTGSSISLDDWRGTISQYALAKDNNGEYIWDETIAEAFHDVYLNKDNAKDASKYIIKVLKEKLGS